MRMNVIPLVNKSFVNGVTLREKSSSEKYSQSCELEVCLKGVLDLSNELLSVYID